MASVAKLVGMEIRDWEKDGKKHSFYGLQMEYVPDSVRGIMGSKVEAVSCPQGVDPNKLEIGHLYELDYRIYEVKGQKYASLQDLLPVEG